MPLARVARVGSTSCPGPLEVTKYRVITTASCATSSDCWLLATDYWLLAAATPEPEPEPEPEETPVAGGRPGHSGPHWSSTIVT